VYEDVLVAESKAEEADLSIVIGSKLEVTPACDWPFLVHKRRGKQKGKVIICNIQKTPKDANADLVINHYTDHIFRLFLQGLQIPLPDTKPTENSENKE